jgi:hypothetical protein
MRKSEACGAVARRLNLSLSRVEALVQRVSEAGLLPVARGSDRPDLGSLELARLLLAAIVDNGLGNAPRSVQEVSALRTESGVVLLDVLEGLIAGRIAATGIRSAIFQLKPAGVTLLSESHLRFGAAQSNDGAAKHIIIPGDALAAIVLEFQGNTPEQADNAIAVSRLAAALH